MLFNKKSELINYLEKKFPLKNAEKWDYPGFSLKSHDKKISNILLCLDVDKNVVERSIKEKVNLIICFHPFRFASKWNEIYKYDPFKKKLVQMLKKNNIDVYSIHTNFDKYKEGTKHWVFKKLNWENKIIKNHLYYSEIKINNSFIDFVYDLKIKLEINNVLTNYNNFSNYKINNILFWPGSGDIYEILKKSKINSNDLIITSDLKWNEQQLLNSEKINFLIVPHIIENVFVDAIYEMIKNKINKDIKIIKFKLDDFIKAF